MKVGFHLWVPRAETLLWGVEGPALRSTGGSTMREQAAAPAKPSRRRTTPARSRRGAAALSGRRTPLLAALGIGTEDGMELASHEAQDARVLQALDALLAR